MNHSEEIAQEKTGRVTAADLLEIAEKGDLTFFGDRVYNCRSYASAFEFKARTSQGMSLESKARVSYEIMVPGFVTNGQKIDGQAHKPESGTWSLYCGMEQIRDVLRTLPKSASITLHVYLDAGTNEGMKEKGLHSDYLYLHAEIDVRGKKATRRFLLDVRCGEHNTARFGVPSRF